MKFKTGCCGPGMALDKYRKIFTVLEVQQTFYQPPQMKTLQKWRNQFGDEFEFTLKAWQLITHTASSPTYKRLKRTLNDKEKIDAGSFKLTPIVKEALSLTFDCAEALGAKSILFQCPASFTASAQNLINIRQFFSEIARPSAVDFYFEPRGDWSPDLIKELCTDLQIFHAVDPLVSATVTPQKGYFRLHGLGGYRYKYSHADLTKIAELTPRAQGGYVFFNNASMANDAERFQSMMQKTYAVS